MKKLKLSQIYYKKNCCLFYNALKCERDKEKEREKKRGYFQREV